MNEIVKKTEPYIQSDLAVNFDKALNRNAVAVYQALVRYMDRNTRITEVRIKTIAKLIDRSEATVRRGLDALIKRGVIVRIPRFSSRDGRQLCNDFYILGGAAPCYHTPNQKLPREAIKVEKPNYIDFCENRFLYNSKEGSHTPHNCDNFQLEEPLEEAPTGLEEVPEVLQTTAKYLSLQTGKKNLTSHEIECLRLLFEKHTPVRIQKEIDTAIKRCKRKRKSLRTVTFNYIWAALKSQRSLPERKPSKPKEEPLNLNLPAKKVSEPTVMTSSPVAPISEPIPVPAPKMTLEEAEQVIAQPDEPAGEPPVSKEHLDFLEALKAKDEELMDKSYRANDLPNPFSDENLSPDELDKALAFEPDSIKIEDYLKLRYPEETDETLHTDGYHEVHEEYDDFKDHGSLEDSFALDMDCAYCKGDAEDCKWRKKCSNGCRPDTWIASDDWGRKWVAAGYSRGFECKAAVKKKNPFFDALVNKSGLTPEQIKQTFSAYTPEVPETVIAKAQAMLAAREGRSLILAGKPGTGKTHLAIAVAIEAMKKDRKVLFRNVPELLDELRKAAREHTNFYEQLMQFKSVSCLVLDDLGKEKTTPAGLDYMYQIIDYRYRHRLQTIITTNALCPDELKNPWNVGSIEPIVSRILEMGDWVKLEAENYRLLQRKC